MPGFFDDGSAPRKSKHEILAALDWELLSNPRRPACKPHLAELIGVYGSDPQTATDIGDLLDRQMEQNPDVAGKMAKFMAEKMQQFPSHPALQDTVFENIVGLAGKEESGDKSSAGAVRAAETLADALPFTRGRPDIQDRLAARISDLVDRIAASGNIEAATTVAMNAESRIADSDQSFMNARLKLRGLVDQAEKKGKLELAINTAFYLAQPIGFMAEDEIGFEAAQKWSGLVDVMAKKDRQAAYNLVCEEFSQIPFQQFFSNIRSVIKQKKAQMEGRLGPGGPGWSPA